MILVPPVIVGVAGLGYVLCLSANWPVHARELLVAAGVALVATEAALVPVNLVHGDAMTATQASLGGTVIHMLLIAALGALAVVSKLVGQEMAFACWMLAFYWASLVALVIGLVMAVQKAAGSGRQATTAPNRSSMQ
jgi:hypothetical protein